MRMAISEGQQQAAGAAIALSASAWFAWHWGRFKARRWGRTVESEALPDAVSYLKRKGLKATSNWRHPQVGDIDIVVMTNKGAVPVEIKSFRKWGSFLLWPGKRERKALQQVQNQMRVLRAEKGLIWLPHAKPSLLQALLRPRKGGVTVVFGAASELGRFL